MDFEMLSPTRKLKFCKLYLEFEIFVFYSFTILVMHNSSPGVSQEKLNKNLLCGISNRKSGSHFGFRFEDENVLWRQKVQSRESSPVAENRFIF